MKVTTNWRHGFLLVIIGLMCATCACKSHSEVQSPANNEPTAAQNIAQAEQFYAQRDDLVKVRQGIISLNQALIGEPGNYDASWRLAKFNYYLATHTENSEEREKAFRDGIEAGKVAIKLQDGKPEGHFWLGAMYGAAAQKSSVAGLATVEDIRNEMERVLQIDQGYQDGSAYMVLGLVYLNAPQIVGGDPQKAVDEMEKGLRFGKNNAFLHLHLAEAYLKVGRTPQARQQLNTIISMPPDQDYLPEYKEAVAEAHKLLEKSG